MYQVVHNVVVMPSSCFILECYNYLGRFGFFLVKCRGIFLSRIVGFFFGKV